MSQEEGQRSQLAETENANLDPTFKQQVQRLHLTVYGRWLFVALLWISIGSLSLWSTFRNCPVAAMLYLVAVRYGLYYNPLPTFGLAFVSVCCCLGLAKSEYFAGTATPRTAAQKNRFIEFDSRGQVIPWKWVCQ